MTDTAQLLSESRTAHQQAKKEHRTGNVATAAEYFRVALDQRLAARASDPQRADPAWLLDAQHPAMPGEPMRRMKRAPSLALAEIAAQQDEALEHYYRVHLGDVAQPAVKVANPEIVAPKRWQVVNAGQPDLCTRAHTFQLLTFDSRTCTVCGQVEELVETLAVEDTEAFKAAQVQR